MQSEIYMDSLKEDRLEELANGLREEAVTFNPYMFFLNFFLV
jgi:hypothetical protein